MVMQQRRMKIMGNFLGNVNGEHLILMQVQMAWLS